MQAARTKLDALKNLAVGAQRCVVIDSACHICPMPGHDLAVSDFLEIKNIQRARRILDEIRGGCSRLGRGSRAAE